jgi:hypothetical protein
VAGDWEANSNKWLHYLPLNQLEALHDAAPWYYEWLDHPPADPWWDWADLTTRYRKTTAAVLNISGWYDEGYGPTGAIENFQGLRAARAGRPSRTQLIIGPWPHGVGGIGRSKAGDRSMGTNASLDYDELVLSWMDRYVREIPNGIDTLPRVRVYLMGADEWLTGSRWPLAGTVPMPLYLSGGDSIAPDGRLLKTRPREDEAFSVFFSDPEHPLTDPYGDASGAHDYNRLTGRSDLLSFDTAPLDSAVDVVGLGDRRPLLQRGQPGHRFLRPAARRGARWHGVQPDAPRADRPAGQRPERHHEPGAAGSQPGVSTPAHENADRQSLPPRPPDPDPDLGVLLPLVLAQPAHRLLGCYRRRHGPGANYGVP